MPENADATLVELGSLNVIAIHGVGMHRPGDIKRNLTTNLGHFSSDRLNVTELNWDAGLPGRWNSSKGAITNLTDVSSNLYVTGTVGLHIVHPASPFDRISSQIQLTLCLLFRWLIAITISLLVSTPAIIMLIVLPILFADVRLEEARLQWLVARSAIALCMAGLTLISFILLLGCVRAVASNSVASLSRSVTSVAVIVFTPFLVLASIPFSFNWVKIGFILAFFAGFGVLASIIELIVPDTSYTVWRDFLVAPYLLGVLGILAVLSGARLFWGRFWHEGLIKIFLDIAKYVGNPEYRLQALNKLGHTMKRAIDSGNTVLIVSHSLGSVVALDYLLNRSEKHASARILLVTLGSPFRRFFIRWLPGILFHTRTNETSVAIASKFSDFRWLNVYRPWDYVGQSLRLEQHLSGLDCNTRQYRRIEGHSNYWSDRSVIEAIRTWIQLTPRPKGSPGFHGPCFASKVRRTSVPEGGGPGLVLLFVLLYALSFGYMIYSVVNQEEELRQERSTLDLRGEDLQVKISHKHIPDVGSELMYAHEFRFLLADQSIFTLQVSPNLPASRDNRTVNISELVDFIRGDCSLEHSPGRFADENLIVCTSNKLVRLVYSGTGEEMMFYSPDFLPEGYSILDWWMIVWFDVGSLLMITVASAPFVLLVSVVFLILIGREFAVNAEMLG